MTYIGERDKLQYSGGSHVADPLKIDYPNLVKPVHCAKLVESSPRTKSQSTSDPKSLLDSFLYNMPAMGLCDDETLWKEACLFFNHDPTNTSEGAKLPGVKMRSRGYQMLDTYKMLRASTSKDWNGTFNASKPGLGKTLEVWMAAACCVLARMSQDHYLKYAKAHDPDDTGRQCHLGHPFGIQCYCI